MTENIYYVGSQNHSSRTYSRFTQNITNRPVLPTQSPVKQLNHSRSTSCPKTQRSRYMHSIQTMRKMSPVYQRNKNILVNVLRLNQNESQSQNFKSGIYDSKSRKSSAFQIIPMKQKQQQGQKVRRVQFKKVEQPRNNQRRVHWKTEMARQAFQSKNMDNIIAQNSNNDEKISKNASQKTESQPPLYLQQLLKDNPHYRVQKRSKYFICTRCYELQTILAVKTHYSQCKIPLKKQQFAHKWNKLMEILHIYEEEMPNSYLYRLIDRMKWYIQEDLTKKEGYILYSEQLSNLLSFKGSINSKYLNEEDLFWLVQTLGDLLQTQALDLTETTFWKICT